MSLLSEDRFETFAQDMDVDVQFDQVGYMFVLTTDEQVRSFRAQFEMWKRLGMPAQWLSRDEIKSMVPALNVDDILAGTFFQRTASAIHINLRRATSARRVKLGVKFLLETEAVGISTSGDKITSVKTNKGELLTNTVVNAAGPYAHQIAGFLGIDLPVVPIKRQIVTTAPLDFISETFPMVVRYWFRIVYA